MAKFEKKLMAQRLRRQGYSVNYIAEKLEVSKSSVSLWCRDMVLSQTQQLRLRNNSIAAGNKGRQIGAEINRKKRLDNIESSVKQGVIEIGKLSDRDLTIIATSLFWAEGAKTGSRFIFINSDPNMILIMMRYLTQVLKIDRARINATVQINRIHEKRIDEIYTFWCSLLNLPREQLGSPYYVEATPKKKYDNFESYNGILRLRVSNGASLQYKLLGYISALR